MKILISLLIRIALCLILAPVLMFTLNMALKGGYWGAVGILFSLLVIHFVLTIKITYGNKLLP